MNKKDLTERDICSKFIGPAVKRAGWDRMMQIREEVAFTKRRIIVRGRLVTCGKAKRADHILNHVADISYTLCSNVKGEANPATPTAKGSKTEIMAYLKGSFDYCDGVYSGFTDAHLNDPADFWGAKTNKMFVLTQVANHDALRYGNLVTYLRLNSLVPSGGWF